MAYGQSSRHLLTMSTAASVQYIATAEVAAARADALYDDAQERFGRPVVQLSRPGHTRVWIEVYFDSEIEARAAAKELGRLRGVAGTAVRKSEPKKWLNFWKHHFKPQDIGRKLRICPVWRRSEGRRPGRKTLWVDPGLSFGTGEHFTTRFCLEMIDRLCEKRAPLSVIDVGTGSGILAMAAARLGCRTVIGTDNDAQALVQARKNLSLNRLSAQVKLREEDITQQAPARRYELVCANILGPVLIEVAPALAALTGRHLVMSGIREADLDGVAAAYQTLGGREIARDGDGEWGGLLFEFDRKNMKRSKTTTSKRRTGGRA